MRGSVDAVALAPLQVERSLALSRDTLGRPPMKLLDIVREVGLLTGGAPTAIVGGVAQMLWARKTFTDDIDLALAQTDLRGALAAVTEGVPGWALPSPPDRAHEQDDVFEVAHLLFDGVVVDLLSFRVAALTDALIVRAVRIPELGGLPFAPPELLLVTQLLRPGTRGAIAALELVVARRAQGGLDEATVRHFTDLTGCTARLDRVLAQADAVERT